MPSGLLGLYIVVWLGMAIGTTAYLRGLDARAKRRQQNRVTLLTFVVIGGFLVGFVASQGQYVGALFGLAVIAAMAYVHLTRNRLCEACNRSIQPTGLLTPVEYCPRCGAKTVRFLLPFEPDNGDT